MGQDDLPGGCTFNSARFRKSSPITGVQLFSGWIRSGFWCPDQSMCHAKTGKERSGTQCRGCRLLLKKVEMSKIVLAGNEIIDNEQLKLPKERNHGSRIYPKPSRTHRKTLLSPQSRTEAIRQYRGNCSKTRSVATGPIENCNSYQIRHPQDTAVFLSTIKQSTVMNIPSDIICFTEIEMPQLDRYKYQLLLQPRQHHCLAPTPHLSNVHNITSFVLYATPDYPFVDIFHETVSSTPS